MSTTDSATDAAQQEAGHLADTTKHEARAVAEEAKAQAHNVVDEARTMLDDQSRTQRDRFVETARTFGDDLDRMTENGPGGLANDVARQLAAKARALGDQLDGREPSDILEDVRGFARQRPGTFLLGALAAGVVVGRLARGAKAAQDSPDTGAMTTSTPTTSARPAPPMPPSTMASPPVTPPPVTPPPVTPVGEHAQSPATASRGYSGATDAVPGSTDQPTSLHDEIRGQQS